MTPEEWRAKVGVRVEHARGRLSIRRAATRAGISEGLWRQIESGQRPLRNGEHEVVSPKPESLAKVSTSLGWTEDSIDRLLIGLDPVSLPDEQPRTASTEQRLTYLEARVKELAGLLREASAMSRTDATSERMTVAQVVDPPPPAVEAQSQP